MDNQIARMYHICVIQMIQERIGEKENSYEILNTRTDLELIEFRDELVIKYNKVIKKEKLLKGFKFSGLKSIDGEKLNFLESENCYLGHDYDGTEVTQGIPDYELLDDKCLASRLEDLYHDQKSGLGVLDNTEINEAITFLETQIANIQRNQK